MNPQDTKNKPLKFEDLTISGHPKLSAEISQKAEFLIRDMTAENAVRYLKQDSEAKLKRIKGLKVWEKEQLKFIEQSIQMNYYVRLFIETYFIKKNEPQTN